MAGSEWLGWTVLAVGLVGALAVDQVLHRGSTSRPSVRRAAVETAIWTLAGIAFTLVVIGVEGRAGGVDYLTGYTLEKSLSLDNVAVFAVVVAAFGVPASSERRLIDHAIIAALVLRLGFVAGGLAVLDRAHSVLFVFAAVLIGSGLRMFRADHDPQAVSTPRPIALIQRLVSTGEPDGARYFTITRSSRGRRAPTPMLIALVALAVTDVIFAVDSVPAIFVVTSNAWIVCAANAFALLGMRPMYFLLATALDRLAYLQRGLAVILVGIGVAMLAEQFVEVPVVITLTFVVGVLAISIGWSLVAARRERPAAASEVPTEAEMVAPSRPLTIVG
jgi:tellurite resistance protein TerC